MHLGSKDLTRCTFSMSTDPRLEAEVNRDCARTFMTRQRTAVNSVAHAPCIGCWNTEDNFQSCTILRPVACAHTMNLLANGALEERGGTGPQHLVQTLTGKVQRDDKKVQLSCLEKNLWKRWGQSLSCLQGPPSLSMSPKQIVHCSTGSTGCHSLVCSLRVSEGGGGFAAGFCCAGGGLLPNMAPLRGR